MAQSRATQRRRNSGRSVASVRRAQSPANPATRRPSWVVAGYFEEGAGRAALRIAAEGAALRGASLRVLDDINGASAAEELVRRSREVDLLVVGTAELGSADALRFDAIARSLSHRAACPVMFVPSAVGDVDVTEVVCGVDRSHGSAAALRWAAREAAMRGGTVLAQQVRQWSEPLVEPPTQSLSGWVFAQQISEPTTIVCHLVCGTSPAAELMHMALQRRAMLVVGTHRSDGGGPHSCTVGRLASRASVPLVVVPPEIPSPRTPSPKPPPRYTSQARAASL